MGAVIYYLTIPFIYLLSILPFPVLYVVSDLIYFILYTCLGYRKTVVMTNLRNSFPEKTQGDLDVICRGFYHHFCDFMMETIKILTISRRGILKRCRFTAGVQALLDGYAAQGKSLIMVMGHTGNWEWPGHPVSLCCRHQLLVLYHPLSNKHFNRLITHMRSRFGTKMVAMNSALKEILARRKELTCTVFIADQTPFPEHAYWTTFLNQDTPVYKGTEAIARKLNYPVIYGSVIKVKRGYYEMHAETLVEEPAATKEGEITEIHTRRLEKDIIAHPESWLWSHKRWKYKRNVV